MKKNFFKIFTVFLGLISCCLPKNNNFKKMKAEEEISYQEIGYLFNVSRVTTETKIYITADERTLISEAGREIFMEEAPEYGTLSNFNQIHEFVELTLARCDYKDLSDIEKFKTLVYSMMAINYKDGNISDCGAFSLGQLLKYSLLTDSFPAKKSKLPDIKIRKLFSNGFIDLVLMKGGYYD